MCRPLPAWFEKTASRSRKRTCSGQAEQWTAKGIESSLNVYRDMRDQFSEALFHSVYGSPVVQALAGLKASEEAPRRRPGVDTVHRAFVAQRAEELMRNVGDGGAREAAIRAALYIRMPEGVADERGFHLLQRHPRGGRDGALRLPEFKKIVRDQFFSLLLDQRRAVAAIPAMLAREPDLASRMVSLLRRLIDVVGVESDVGKTRLAEIEALLKERPAASRTARPRRRGEAISAPNCAK